MIAPVFSTNPNLLSRDAEAKIGKYMARFARQTDRQKPTLPSSGRRGGGSLSPVSLPVVRALAAEGKIRSEIAEALCISPQTVSDIAKRHDITIRRGRRAG